MIYNATHWTASDDPEQWMDDPNCSIIGAAEEALASDDDDAWERRNDLLENGRIEITVFGFVQTREPLAADNQFDGYEPGCEYFKPTGETQIVTIEIAYSIKERKPCPAS